MENKVIIKQQIADGTVVEEIIKLKNGEEAIIFIAKKGTKPELKCNCPVCGSGTVGGTCPNGCGSF